MMISAGPDREFEVEQAIPGTPYALITHYPAWITNLALGSGGSTADETATDMIYDPTNGTISDGDIMRDGRGIWSANHLGNLNN